MMMREAKPSFESIPPNILDRVSAIAGARVTDGDVAWGGFSASAGFVMTLDNGAKIFAKGTHPDEMAHGTLHLRQEIAAYEDVPVLKDISPAYLGCVDDGDEDGWALGVWRFVAQTDTPPDCTDIFAALSLLRAAQATSLRPCTAQNYIQMFLTSDRKWQRLATDAGIRDAYAAAMADTPWGAGFLRAHLGDLCRRQGDIAQALPALPWGVLHGDLRTDNILKGRDCGRTYMIDWPNVCYGPHAFDLLTLFADMQSLGQGRMADLFADYAAATGFAYDPQHTKTLAVCIAGFFADQVRRARPEKLPRLRAMQKRLLTALLEYIF